MQTLTVGTRIYNHGDIANASHFGTIIKVERGHYFIKPDDDPDRSGTYTVPYCMVSPKFEGHSGTRIVTEAAYKAWKAE